MDEDGWTCERCGAAAPGASSTCPSCGARRPGRDPAAPVPSPPAGAPAARSLLGGPHRPEELLERAEKLAQWAEAARPLGVQLPTLPAWAQEAITRTEEPRLWADGIARLEQEARSRCSAVIERMREELTPRLLRLEAYSVGTRLERDQLREAVRAARAGDIASTLWMLPQIDRVVSVKERHLEQAREDVERLLTLLRDLEAMGFRLADPPGKVATELEADLRGGRLAALRQRIRAVRSQSVAQLEAALPGYVGRIGDRLAADRARGLATDLEVRELAEAARNVLDGRTEDGARQLRRVAVPRGLAAETPPSG